MTEWAFFHLTLISSLLREPIFCSTTIKNGWLSGFKMAPRCALGWIPRITGTGKWPPYGVSLLDAEVLRPLECIEPVFNAFQWAFSFRLTRISLNSDFNGTNYPRQARHHCTFVNDIFQNPPGWLGDSGSCSPKHSGILSYAVALSMHINKHIFFFLMLIEIRE